jgi:serine/threonine protein kinase
VTVGCPTPWQPRGNRQPATGVAWAIANVVVVSEGVDSYEVAMIDLGHAEALPDPWALVEARLGTAPFQAPEQTFLNDVQMNVAFVDVALVPCGQCGLGSDVFALGGTLLYVLSGLMPWTQPRGDRMEYVSFNEIREAVMGVCTRVSTGVRVERSFVDPTCRWGRFAASAKGIPALMVCMLRAMFQLTIRARPTASEVVDALDASICAARAAGYTERVDGAASPSSSSVVSSSCVDALKLRSHPYF